MSASLAEAKPPRLNTRHSFKAKESKSLDMVRSDIHILDLKKHRAQTEVDMLSEAISRIAESDGTTDSSDGEHAALISVFFFFHTKNDHCRVFCKCCDGWS